MFGQCCEAPHFVIYARIVQTRQWHLCFPSSRTQLIDGGRVGNLKRAVRARFAVISQVSLCPSATPARTRSHSMATAVGAMEAPPQPIDALLLPGMMELNVKEALGKAESLCVETREGAALCGRLLGRLVFLRDELRNTSSQHPISTEHLKISAQFANLIGLVIRFFKKVSDKKLLQRIAANRLIVEEVERLHEAIDDVFRAAGLADSSQMAKWREAKETDITTLRSNLEDLVRNRNDLVNTLSESELEEALTEIRFEIELKKNRNVIGDLLESVFAAVLGEAAVVVVPEIHEWFIRRDDLVLEEEFAQGSFGVAYKSIWEIQEVCVKELLVDGPQARESFLEVASIWRELSHPNVIQMHGGCHVGKPFFFVSEYAENSNFRNYLLLGENKSKMWRLFLQAAEGLAYLHSNSVIHAELKCNNLLVSGDGSAKLSDFGFDHIRTLSVGISVKELPSSTHWKAPECLLEQGDGANPSFKTDVYALGMSIIEAKIGDLPWGKASDGDIIDQIATGEGYPRPEGIFTDNEWDLVRAMTEFEVEERWALAQVIEVLEQLVREEEAAISENIVCGGCQSNNLGSKRFCGDCGGRLVSF